MYGIALDSGLLRLDATLADLGIDDLHPLTGAEKRATVRHLLQARSGVYHAAAYADAGQTRGRPERGSTAPGARWFYNNWDFNALEAILERRAARDLFALYDAWLARPLGMQDFDPAQGFEALEPTNSRHAAHVVRLSARDLARVGQMYMNGGVWGGRRIVSRAWIDSSLATHSDAGNGAGYGLLWWTYEPGALRNYPSLNRHRVVLARGTGGQALFLIPQAELLVVHRGDSDNGVNVPGSVIWSLVERILSARERAAVPTPALRPMVEVPFQSQRPAPAPRSVVALGDSARSAVVANYAMVGGDASIRVFEYQERLFINAPGEGEAEMYASAPDEFFLPAVPGVSVTFERDAQGVSALVLVIGDQRIRAPRRR
jgi:CubicO group peptidase (beta-lactamase class C family)